MQIDNFKKIWHFLISKEIERSGKVEAVVAVYKTCRKCTDAPPERRGLIGPGIGVMKRRLLAAIKCGPGRMANVAAIHLRAKTEPKS
jgi:hypothetical protein